MGQKDIWLTSDSTSERHETSPAKRSGGDIKSNEQDRAQSKLGCSNTGTRDSRSSQLFNVQHGANEYNMHHTRRGLAIIFNHSTFDAREYVDGEIHKPPNRDDTNYDREELQLTFQKLGFEVECLDDKTHDEIKQKLEQVSSLDHSDNDCLVVAVLTHDEGGGLLDARDQEYLAKELWEPFTATNCRSLAGKPKLFFIQACRIQTRDHRTRTKNAFGDLIEAAPVIPPASFQVPSSADFLISYATFDETVVCRNSNSVSRYVQRLCVELEDHGGGKDLTSKLTDVNQKMAEDLNSLGPQRPFKEIRVEVPSLISSLTRLVYL